MYRVYAFATPNSIKVPIALEELGVPYTLESVNIRQGQQKSEAFLALNSNGKVPVLVDDDQPAGHNVLTESAAILVYLAEKHSALLPRDGMARARVFEQLFFHASGISANFGQSGFFQRLASEKLPFAIDRFHGEAQRLAGILDGVLSHHEFVAGESFSIADIAHFGWMWRREFAGIDFEKTPNLARWYQAVSSRLAVLRAIARVEALVPPAVA